MDYKNTKAANTTVTYDKDSIEAPTNNIYEAITIIAKRAEQINTDIRRELVDKLEEINQTLITLTKVINKFNK